MSDDAHQTSTALTVAQPRQVRIPVEDVVPVYDTARFEQYGRIAAVMARSSLVPATVREGDGVANCFQVVELADRWGYSPFAVAQCASVVHGKLMLEGKLVAAVLESKLGIELNHYYTGEWGQDDYRIFVTDSVLTPEQIDGLKPHIKIPGVKIIDGSVGEWKTWEGKGPEKKAKGNWLAQPDVQLQYRGDRTWARLFKSALMLGVLTDDEVEDFADRQEPRKLLTAGPDVAALDAARQTMVQPITDPAPPKSLPEPEPQSEIAAPKPAKEEAREADAEPDPPGAADAEKTTAPAGEVYLLAGEESGEDGKRTTYKNGIPFSRASDKAAGRLKTFDLHAPEVAEEARPTETGSAQAAEPQPATSASADPVSAASPDPEGSGREASAPEPPAPESVEDDGSAMLGGVEEEDAVHPMIAAKMEIDGANSAQEIMAIIQRVAASQPFRDTDEKGRILFRMAAWERYVVLKNKGIEDGVVTGNVIIFALWVEFGAKTKAEIDNLWATFYVSEVYKGLNDGWRRALAVTMTKRKAVLS
jgi:hypothetical protein